MASSRCRTPSPAPSSSVLDLCTPEPASPSGRPSRAPKAPSKAAAEYLYLSDSDEELDKQEGDEDDDEEYESLQQSSPSKSKKARASSSSEGKSKAVAKQSKTKPKPKAVKKKVTDDWEDIPDWGDSDECFLWSLPSELLDKILGSPILTLRDHVALAASCRILRACYYTASSSSTPKELHNPLWTALMGLRPPSNFGNSTRTEVAVTAGHERLVARIFSNEKKVDAEEMEMLWEGESGEYVLSSSKGKKRARVVNGDEAIRSGEWDEAIDMVTNEKITKTDALKHYKLNEKQLNTVPCWEKPNPYGGRNSAPMRLYREAQVEAKALKVHGGAVAHQQLLDKRAETARKAAATRVKNGTVRQKSYSAPRVRYSSYRYGRYSHY